MGAFSRVVWCRTCETGYECGRQIPPAACPCDGCGADGEWWTPTTPFRLTLNDRRFLRSLRIAVENTTSSA